MSRYLTPGLVAVVVGLVLAVVLFLPFVAASYRRRGELRPARALWWLAALVYAMALWAYTLFPFPEPGSFACAAPQLQPGRFVSDILDEGVGSVSAIARNPAVLQVVFNVVLFLPLGVLLRYFTRRGVIVSTVVGFLVSLAIEVTQLTGLWGVYACAYRLFDVDDLLANTAGAFLGALVGLAVVRRGDGPDASSPRPVTVARRLLGMLCDLVIVGAIVAVVEVSARVVSIYILHVDAGTFDGLSSVVAYTLALGIQLASIMARGSTVGERMVLLRGVVLRSPAPATRFVRFLFGIGGFTLLGVADLPFAGLVQFVLGVTSLVMVFTTRGHRGTAAAVAGMDVEDARTRGARASTEEDA